MTRPLRRDVAATPLPAGLPDYERGLNVPDGVGGWAQREFEPVVRTFAKMFANRVGGGGLCVYVDGEPALDIWAGEARQGQPWTRDTAAMVFSASKGVTSTVIHRLADRGLLTYDAPIARYWPEFGTNGKESITVRDALDHKAGLSRLTYVNDPQEVLDHELMERRLAAAPIGRYHGKPAYHAISHGWLLAGIARAITSKSMRELYRTELAEPLGIDGIHLGQPPTDSPTIPSAMYDQIERRANLPIAQSVMPAGARMLNRTPFIRDFVNTIYLPGLEQIMLDDGTGNAPIYRTQMGAGNAFVTAPAMAKLYSALATDGSVEGRRLLSTETVAGFERGLMLQLDRTLALPMGTHLGYHSLALPGLRGGFGHLGAGGSAGWADRKRRIAVGLSHNRIVMPNPVHNAYFVFLWRRILQSLR
ncbi:serine hydrolase domain-containing protein [Mycobacteroides chelonae]|uniref:serine hydrolase domain-containing protein n=1 Tax=Mycobacteroides chelonae TaxID=1774 RepID=UPI0004AAE5E1|nr:serine hydrolase domain-containing protein [Mycobacteroides chelonae]OHT70859.1 esterase [Mycobacteroides chelonae]OHT71785.1 esterase [Mycobacteroides chelonae]OHT86292.1 esterase [Mycobacteroides chelonae]